MSERQLDPGCIPPLIPAMPAIVEGLGGSVGREAKAVDQKVPLAAQLIAIGCRVAAVYPAQLDAVAIAQQQVAPETPARRRLQSDAILDGGDARLRGRQILVAATQDDDRFLFRIDIDEVWRADLLEPVTERRRRVPLPVGIAFSVLQARE